MIQQLIKLQSNINGQIAHLLVELSPSPITTGTLQEFCLDFIKQLGLMEAKNKEQQEAQAALATESAPAQETTEQKPAETSACL